ncbi:MAG: hypothetical protein N3B12_06105 [Armatimonadetes bacterium]|nr:hypothetical protein [Armatimonadota bacterium]
MLGIQLDDPLTEERKNELVDSIAKRIVSRRLETPAVFLLEMHRPLSFIASQAALVAMPFLAPLVGAQRVADFSRLLADHRSVELLIRRIEEMSAERDQPSPSPT